MTGVQTCALPISSDAVKDKSVITLDQIQSVVPAVTAASQQATVARSSFTIKAVQVLENLRGKYLGNVHLSAPIRGVS